MFVTYLSVGLTHMLVQLAVPLCVLLQGPRVIAGCSALTGGQLESYSTLSSPTTYSGCVRFRLVMKDDR